MDASEFSLIDEQEQLSLEWEFDREKVVKTLKEINGDKAAGPGGFTMAFFQHCWWVLAGDVMAFLL